MINLFTRIFHTQNYYSQRNERHKTIIANKPSTSSDTQDYMGKAHSLRNFDVEDGLTKHCQSQDHIPLEYEPSNGNLEEEKSFESIDLNSDDSVDDDSGSSYKECQEPPGPETDGLHLDVMRAQRVSETTESSSRKSVGFSDALKHKVTSKIFYLTDYHTQV